MGRKGGRFVRQSKTLRLNDQIGLFLKYDTHVMIANLPISKGYLIVQLDISLNADSAAGKVIQETFS
jgi:hypothetical protein